MVSEALIGFALILMLVYLISKNRILAFCSWFVVAAACILKIPIFYLGEDYYNVAVFIAGSILFILMAFAALKNSKVIYYTTRFSTLSIAIYSIFAFTNLGEKLIEITALFTVFVGNLVGFPMIYEGFVVTLNGRAVEIILACTAIESIALFAGATLGVDAPKNRRLKAFFLSVPTIYILNIFRNVFVIASFGYSWFGEKSFYIAHNVVAKIFSTIALVAIAYAVFTLLPELLELVENMYKEIKSTVKFRFSESNSPRD
ncbi:MAG: archaeosortase A [Archaeoglobales archaeon]|nr:archaeosortase A [Archaeoglobales archaeon]